MFLDDVLRQVIAPNSVDCDEWSLLHSSSRFGGEDWMAEFAFERNIATWFVFRSSVCVPVPERMLIHALGLPARRTISRHFDGDGAFRPAGVTAEATRVTFTNLHSRYISMVLLIMKNKHTGSTISVRTFPGVFLKV